MSGKTEIKAKLKSELAPYIDSRQPVILAVLDEEDRFLRCEETVLTTTQRVQVVYVIDYNGKLIDRKNGLTDQFNNPRDVIEWFAKEHKPPEKGQTPNLKANGPVPNSILIFFDIMFHMQDPQGIGHSNPGLTRVIKNVQSDLLKHSRSLILVGNQDFVPPELKHHIAVVKYPLPDRDYMRNVVRLGCKWFAKKEEANNPDKWLQLTDDEELLLATLLLGFRGWEAENVLARAAHENNRKRKENPEHPMGFDVEVIRNAKVETIRSNPALRIVIPHSTLDKKIGMDQIGGAGELKRWFSGRQKLFLEEARGDGIDMPKGAILFGTGGTGKDYAVENLAQSIGWTTLYADLGASKGPLQGQSHKGYREIISAAEAQAPCFLVLSEWEKTMAGAFAGGVAASLDPTSSEIFASFLNWMQNRKAPIFVWALTNDITIVPQPALRAGRWDKIWFMDLPHEWEREAIFHIHLQKRGWSAEEYNIDVPALAAATEGYTGAEIAAVVNEGITLKYLAEGTRAVAKVTTDHFVEAINLVSASIKLKKAEIDALRDYAKKGNIATANSITREDPSAPQPTPRKLGTSLVSQLG